MKHKNKIKKIFFLCIFSIYTIQRVSINSNEKWQKHPGYPSLNGRTTKNIFFVYVVLKTKLIS